ncbi:ABC transporter ATP-binding protein [Neglecta sp. X4]|uniref:ABC transporter ATP-binding protein n=1 Tax=unclassified Neglectibacter TaxID=2632164 RepID=UPI00136C3BD0|nr:MULTISPECIES: ABC transporter ATP-binding protein [unclassified Neglectibacter]NBI17931.1 ABC transporter ATP-binding protein [Neglectibacter sp. 59]NBJ73656.1 ABC transporter ATP-binding protein [Neglectibacter sp. X4]NCE81391.1 ABC transporter ATP-binding protein [Neglectibacter sp. X58]
MGTLLEAKGLVKKYREGSVESKAVDQVDLLADQGDFLVIMGASGSGKTSLLHLIAGIDQADSGTIQYARDGRQAELSRMGEPARTVFRRENIGIVFQQHCLVPDLTVYENILLPVLLRKKRKEAGKESILELCGQFGLRDHVRKYPSQLSGGQQQRAAILRAVINKPPLLLCDEPTGSLNSAQSEAVMELLGKLNENGQTIILVTHDIKVAAKGKRILYIQDGRAAGELKLPEGKGREEALSAFLQQRGW